MKNVVSIITENRLFMSPLAGISDISFRLIIQRYNCPFAFTEMIDVNGICYKNGKTLDLMKRDTDKITKGVQIVGNEEDKILMAAKTCADHGFELLELNAACPVKKVVKSGKGAALLREPEKLGKIISRLTNELTIPVTVKMRAGYSDNELNYLEVAKIIASSGAAAICIHPRTKMQMYGGHANHKITQEVKNAIDIPVFASGDIFTAEDATNILKETNCDAVAIARGALGKPWIFTEINNSLKGQKITVKVDFEDLKKIILEHVDLSLRYIGERRTFPRMQKHTRWYLHPYRNRHFIMQHFSRVRNLKTFRNFIHNLTLMENNSLYLTNLNFE